MAKEEIIATAAEKVLGVVEFLESILLNLPPIDLFVLQRVNTKFRDTIKGSSALQDHMLNIQSTEFPISLNGAIYPLYFFCKEHGYYNDFHIEVRAIRVSLSKRRRQKSSRPSAGNLRSEESCSWRNIRVGGRGTNFFTVHSDDEDTARCYGQFKISGLATLGQMVDMTRKELEKIFPWYLENR